MEEEFRLIKTDKNFYWLLFKSTFIVSMFTVGGGYVIIPLLKAKYVDEYHWITDEETLNMVAIAQSTPGVMAVNTAIMLGYRMAGVAGALTGMLATVLPPLIIITIVATFYDLVASNEYVQLVLKGMQCGATALLLNVAIDLLKKQFSKKLLLPIVIILGTFVANLFFGVNIMLLVAIDGIVGFFLMRDKKYE
ncbi:MAG: chromate transporter [Selenomonadaceae bacterium]|nr:chromate transporter [Selenomonadaceae bacterium]MBQ6131615.1 chromate transporter [Selenomonadaceae bacterium]